MAEHDHEGVEPGTGAVASEESKVEMDIQDSATSPSKLLVEAYTANHDKGMLGLILQYTPSIFMLLLAPRGGTYNIISYGGKW